MPDDGVHPHVETVGHGAQRHAFRAFLLEDVEGGAPDVGRERALPALKA